MKTPQPILVKFFLLLTLLLPASFAFAGDNDWRPVSAEELSRKEPKVEAGAAAEAIFWEVRVDDGIDLVLKHYIRIKIFTESGREKYAKIDIPYIKGMKVKEVMARVTKPDGSFVELKKEDVFEKDIVKADGIKVKAKSFAVPSIEPGVVIEYRYQEVLPGADADGMRLLFQRDIPIEVCTYYFKPEYDTKYIPFNLEGNKLEKDKNGFYKASLTNVPALKEEPRMPPEDEVRAWMILEYISNTRRMNTDNYWARIGGALAYIYDIKDTLKPGGDIKQAAAQITAGASSDEEKIQKIFEYCRSKIKNITFDATLTDDDKEKIKFSKSTSDTLKKAQGRATEINELFASLAVAAGFEARLAFSGDRSELFFSPRKAHETFVHMAAIAVKLNGNWKYYDPGSPFTPFGMLPWFEEDTAVFLLASKDYITTETPLSDYTKSLAKRTGKFTLLDDGTLEGDVKLEYTGHLAYARRIEMYDVSANKREELLKDEFKVQMSAADISAITIDHLTDPEKPLTYTFKVKVPNYAQKAGKRLFLQPGFFEYGSTPEFTSESRKYDIVFSYPWSEHDSIQIQLPKGFQLDSADTPGAFGDPERVSYIDVKIGIDAKSGLMTYDRKFYFGKGGLFFPVRAYKPIKSLFDAFHKANIHSIALKQQ